jgi:hypothetical protein
MLEPLHHYDQLACRKWLSQKSYTALNWLVEMVAGYQQIPSRVSLRCQSRNHILAIQ